MAGAVGIRGLRELQRDLKKYADDVQRDLKRELKAAAEPVREGAERLAVREIRNLTSATAEKDWWRMKLGVNSRVVYVAPGVRNQGGSHRPNLGLLLLNRAMEPSLEEHRSEVIRDLERMLDRLAVRNGF